MAFAFPGNTQFVDATTGKPSLKWLQWLSRIHTICTNPTPTTSVVLQIYDTAPASSAGMLVIADGVGWDPGSGAGLYRRNEADTAWVFVG